MTKTEYREYLSSPHWKNIRERAIIDSENRCSECQIPRWLAEIAYAQDLNVHHLSYAHVGHESPEDVEVLCARCHELETFGRTELRAPKESHCSICEKTHWDYRSDLCSTCSSIMEHKTGDRIFEKRLPQCTDFTFGQFLCILGAHCEDESGNTEWSRVAERLNKLANIINRKAPPK